jgi:branched-subunit amino acid transport protein
LVTIASYTIATMVAVIKKTKTKTIFMYIIATMAAVASI